VPAPRGEDEADEREGEASGEERERAEVRVLADTLSGRDLGDQQRQQGRADDDAHTELGGS